MVEDVVSREVFLGDLICGRFMNSNSEVTDTVDFPDLAWLALDLGETRVTLIGILRISPWSAFLGRPIHRDEAPGVSHVTGTAAGERLTVVESLVGSGAQQSRVEHTTANCERPGSIREIQWQHRRAYGRWVTV